MNCGLLPRILNVLGFDRAIALTVITKSWGAFSGLATLFFIARYFSPTEQGYYYTFYSLIALQIFMELGLNYVVIQMIGHESAFGSWLNNSVFQVNEVSKKRIRSIIVFQLRWFGIAGAIMILFLMPLGGYFLIKVTDSALPWSQLLIPWIFLVVSAALNLYQSAIVAILEGVGLIEKASFVRLIQSLSSSIILWLIIFAGGKLYALGASALISALIGSLWVFRNYRSFFKDLLSDQNKNSNLNWRKEIFPFHWRVAVSWMSGYLSFQIFVPAIAASSGPIAAGRFGMSMQIINALTGIAAVWISTKIQILGKLTAEKRYKLMDNTFFYGFKQSLLVLIFEFLILLAFIIVIREYKNEIYLRILPINEVLVLMVGSFVNHIIGAQGIYLRAFKREPYLILSIMSGLITAVASTIFIPNYGAIGACYVLTTVSTLFSLPVSIYIFFNKRKEYRCG